MLEEDLEHLDSSTLRVLTVWETDCSGLLNLWLTLFVCACMFMRDCVFVTLDASASVCVCVPVFEECDVCHLIQVYMCTYLREIVYVTEFKRKCVCL